MACLFRGPIAFLGTWPRAGTTRSGRAYERAMSVLRTVASACSSSPGVETAGETWLSPNTTPDSTSNHGVKEGIPSSGKSLAKQARGDWPTPTESDSASAGNRNLEGSKAHAGTSLTDAVTGGQAPRRPSSTPDALSASETSSEARQWPTPRAEDSESSGARHTRGTADTLTAATRQHEATAPSGAATPSPASTDVQWPTPTANEDSYRLQGNSQQSKCLTAVLISPAGLPGPASPSTPGSPRASSVVLNPAWVSCLQGFPPDFLVIPVER